MSNDRIDSEVTDERLEWIATEYAKRGAMRSPLPVDKHATDISAIARELQAYRRAADAAFRRLMQAYEAQKPALDRKCTKRKGP